MKKSVIFLFLLLISFHTSAQRQVGFQINCNAILYFQETKANMGGDLNGRDIDYYTRDFLSNENIYQFRPFWRVNMYNTTRVSTAVELGTYKKYPDDIAIHFEYNSEHRAIYSLNACIREAFGVEWKGTSIDGAILLNNEDVLITVSLSRYETVGNIKLTDTFIPIGTTGVVQGGAIIPQVIATTTRYGLIFSKKKSYTLYKVCQIPENSQLVASVYGGFYCLNISDKRVFHRYKKHPNLLYPFTSVYYYSNDGVFQWLYKANDGEEFYTINQTASTIYCGGYTKNRGYIGFRNSYVAYLDRKSGNLKDVYYAPKPSLKKDSYIYNIHVGTKDIITNKYNEVLFHDYCEESREYRYSWVVQMNDVDKIELDKIRACLSLPEE